VKRFYCRLIALAAVVLAAVAAAASGQRPMGLVMPPPPPTLREAVAQGARLRSGAPARSPVSFSVCRRRFADTMDVFGFASDMPVDQAFRSWLEDYTSK